MGQNLPYLITAFPIFSIRPKFSTRSISDLPWDVFSKDKVNSSLYITVFNKLVVNKDIKYNS